MNTKIGVKDGAMFGDDGPLRFRGKSSGRTPEVEFPRASGLAYAIWLWLTEVVPGAGAVITYAWIVRRPLGEKKVMISSEGIVAPHSYPKLWYGRMP